jgi:hypothetical protein
MAGRASRCWLRCARPRLEILEARVVPTFIEAPSFAAGLAPAAVEVGDFNGDGTPDVVVANNTSNGTVSVLLGNHDGTFQPPKSYAAGINPISVAAIFARRPVGHGNPPVPVPTPAGSAGKPHLVVGLHGRSSDR